MSERRHCDRCNAMMTSQNQLSGWVELTKKTLAYRNEEHKIDLCPECCEAFLRFMGVPNVYELETPFPADVHRAIMKSATDPSIMEIP